MHRDFIEAGAPRGAARAAGVAVHGRGGKPQTMIALADRLALPGTRWVAPRAEGGSWYPRRFMEPAAQHEPQLSEAVLACEQALVEASDYGRIPADRSVMIGFSQGACLVTEFLLRHPRRVAAAVVFTGGLIGADATTWRPARGTLDGLRVLITGSDADEWVPESRTRETADVLTALGALVHLRLYPGRPHIVSDEEVAAAREFIDGVLAGANPASPA